MENHNQIGETRRIVSTWLLIAFLASIFGCQRIAERFDRRETNTESIASPNVSATLPIEGLRYGNPSNATSDPSNKDNYLLVRDSVVLSYNNSRGTANWVAWTTTREDLGDSIPRSLFQPDDNLPAGFKRIAYYDYSGSGYDRGHMLPSADRFGNRKLNKETFLMTNIVPQTGDLNQFPWEQLESYSRLLARSGNTIYTIAGDYGENGRLRGKVTVPTNCWKIIAVLPRGRDKIDTTTRIIAVDMPNIDGIKNTTWQKYRTTVRAIEQKTGYDLFSLLPRDVQDRLETAVDNKN